MMGTQANYKGRSLRCPRCQLAFTILITPVRCPHCGYLIPREFVETQSGCLTNFGISLAMGIGCALWAAAVWAAESNPSQSPGRGKTFDAAIFGFVAGAIVGWILSLLLPRTTAEKLTLITNCTGLIALISATLGAPTFHAILIAIAVGFPAAAFLWRIICSQTAAETLLNTPPSDEREQISDEPQP